MLMVKVKSKVGAGVSKGQVKCKIYFGCQVQSKAQGQDEGPLKSLVGGDG